MRIFESMKEFKAYADKIAKKYNFKISKYNEDFSIDVDGEVVLYNSGLKKLPIKFNIVLGSFNCFGNELKSLEGCPKYVGGNFNCYYNQLTSLEYAPEYVRGWFDCLDNKLISLKGAPEIIRGKWHIEDKYKSFHEYQKYLLVKKIEAL